MTTIPVKVCGDVWCDPDQFLKDLEAADVQQSLQIDLRTEGPSIAALGILQALRQHCANSGRDPASIRLIRAPNTAEVTEFTNDNAGSISHFFAMSVKYWQPVLPICEEANRFAMFVGRTTWARCAMMYKIYHDPELQAHFKFSTMNYDGRPIWEPYEGWLVIERSQDWLSPQEFDHMAQWWQDSRPASLDGHRVQDQYVQHHNTNGSLLRVYHQFHIELVCETYTLGDTFFPTEKTVRSLMAAKPFMTYGPVGFLSRLRDLGFQTFHNYWDESYDQYQGVERWHRMHGVIKSLCAMPRSQFIDLMDKIKPITAHNRRNLADLVLTSKADAIYQAGIT